MCSFDGYSLYIEWEKYVNVEQNNSIDRPKTSSQRMARRFSYWTITAKGISRMEWITFRFFSFSFPFFFFFFEKAMSEKHTAERNNRTIRENEIENWWFFSEQTEYWSRTKQFYPEMLLELAQINASQQWQHSKASYNTRARNSFIRGHTMNSHCEQWINTRNIFDKVTSYSTLYYYLIREIKHNRRLFNGASLPECFTTLEIEFVEWTLSIHSMRRSIESKRKVRNRIQRDLVAGLWKKTWNVVGKLHQMGIESFLLI